ncbi:MAG TPA: PASTA domain-containing protein, partial [Candidatus Hydrogenedentes bacterium]|nr:PASTA domain-containing protein [Candidatus Hydrogenedentota bacterium]
VVSLGVRMIAVPDLSGMTAAGAEAVLLGADLTLGAVTEVNSDTVPAGQVMGQSPAPGVEVLEGTAVAVTVSLGPLPVAVPNVTGMAQAAAAAALSGAGLAAGQVSESYSATVPAGSVISQNPAAGTLVLPGAAVALEVSKGPAPAGDIPVPNLAGMTQAQAGAALTAAELSLGTVSEVYNATVPAGQVISQSPAAGVEVAAGTAVNLTVSRGPEPVVVPDVTGMTQANAAAALTGAGLDVGQVVQAFSDTIPVGRVISQDPAADAEVPPGTAVDLEVSKGPAPAGDIAVPSLAGMTQAQAGAALTGATLALGAVTEAYSATVPAGQVISQNPAAGAMVAAATPVNIVLSKGPHPADGVAVPDTAYMTGAVAEGMITGDGLTVGQTTEECSGTVPEGRVVRTDPAAGTVVAPGTAVNLHVSSGPCPVAVPNVAGMTQSAAEAAVTGAGLTVGAVTEAFSDTVPAGSVISQDPAAGAQAQPGAAVALVVSKGVDQAVSDAARASLAGMFEDADTDGDGSLSFGEVQAAAPTVTQLVFNALDADGDGLLSAEELGVETGCGCGCKKSDMTVDGLKSRMGDLFLGGLALALLAAAGRRRMP